MSGPVEGEHRGAVNQLHPAKKKTHKTRQAGLTTHRNVRTGLGINQRNSMSATQIVTVFQFIFF